MNSMKRPVITLVTAATFCVSAAWVTAPAFAQTPAATSASRPSNDTLESAIEKKWEADAALKNADIDVEVADGVATLTGDVKTAALKSRAEKLAKVDGITRVVNNIEVDPRTTAEKAKAGTEKAANKAAEGVGTAAHETKKAAKTTGEVISDTWITGKVKAQFIGEDALKHSDITVHTNNNVVTLTGTVASEAGRKRAVDIAKATDGVKDVVDKLTIAPGKTEE
jgi:hyperosmotically inducible periplasmic protein